MKLKERVFNGFSNGKGIKEYFEIVIPFNNETEAMVWYVRIQEFSLLPVQIRKIEQNW